jgi:hypothetical protein
MRADFIIVGVMKSGTTTLAHHFTHHPDIAIPANEIHYFDYDHFYSQGDEWYHRQLLVPGKEKSRVTGEKTPYSFYPWTAERIFNYRPDMKLLWIFRNPVDRAYSNYTHDLFNIDEWRSFDRCIREEEKRPLLYQYLSKGRYVEQVEQYLRFFPKEQMRFVLFENLMRDPEKEIKPLLEFAGADPERFHFKPELHSKKSLYPKYHPALLYFYKKIIGRGGRGWNYLWRINFSSALKRPMNPETRQKLLEYYRPWNEKLSRLLEADLDVWDK